MSALQLKCYVGGEAVVGEGAPLEVRYPYDGSLTGTVACAGPADVELAIELARASVQTLTRYQRADILRKARQMLEGRRDEFARLIRLETGLCQRETLYEVGRSLDVLEFAAMETLKDDGQVFSCDLTAQGKARKIFTLREPVALVAAITPFNHPLNQVTHKVAPAVASGATLLGAKERTCSARACALARARCARRSRGWAGRRGLWST